MSSNNENTQMQSAQCDKMANIEYALLILGVILVIFQIYHIYRRYCNTCVKTTNQSKPLTPSNDSSSSSLSSMAHSVLAPSEYMSVKNKKKQSVNPLNERDLAEYLSNGSGDMQAAYDPIAMSVEKSVIDSHKSFVNDAFSMTPTPALSVRDDPNDINPWVGLRRIDYSGVVLDGNARSISTEAPDQMRSTDRHSYIL
jgi:hypothetical protein